MASDRKSKARREPFIMNVGCMYCDAELVSKWEKSGGKCNVCCGKLLAGESVYSVMIAGRD